MAGRLAASLAAALPVRGIVLVVSVPAFVLIAVVFGGEEAHACKCAKATPEERLEKSDAVFAGVLEEANEDEEPTSQPSGGRPLGGSFTFEVEALWKGVSEERIVVYDSRSPCAVSSLREGERYLVFANCGGRGEDAPLGTSICSGTVPLESPNAEEALRAIGPAERGALSGPDEPGEGAGGGGEATTAEEIPRTGGPVGATLLLPALCVVGALMVVGGLLARRIFRSP